VLSFKKPEDAVTFNELAQNPEFRYELKSLPPSPAALRQHASAQTKAPAEPRVTPEAASPTQPELALPAAPSDTPSAPEQLEQLQALSGLELEVLLALKKESAEPPPEPTQGTP
jgi:hypothetical protein